MKFSPIPSTPPPEGWYLVRTLAGRYVAVRIEHRDSVGRGFLALDFTNRYIFLPDDWEICLEPLDELGADEDLDGAAWDMFEELETI
jgi:hypothetical protein